MISSSPCSPSFRRGSLVSQLDFEDFLKMEKTSSVGPEWSQDNITSHSLIPQTKSLQVVPDLDDFYIPSETTSSLQNDFKDLHLSFPKITVNLANETSLSLQERTDDTIPRSPFLPRTSISEIDNLGILSPLFSVMNTSPLIKTPTTLYEICCSSRKSSDDLSIYLPDNFTPASLESLDKSIYRTVFQFPTAAPRNETTMDDVFIQVKGGKPNILSSLEFPAVISESREESENVNAVDAPENLSTKREEEIVDSKLIDIALVKEKRAKKKRKNQELRQQRKRQKKCSEVENETIGTENRESSPIVRNKLERDRRSDLNNRFKKLRESVPYLATKDKASKMDILRAAAEYVNELIEGEQCLEEKLKNEKARNKLLLKNLVIVSSNYSDDNK